MGGVIRYITNKPNLQKFSGNFTGGLSSTDGGDGSNYYDAMLNVPIVKNKLGVRVSGSFENVGGYLETNDGTTENFNDADIEQIRAQLLFLSTDDLSFKLLYQTNSADQKSIMKLIIKLLGILIILFGILIFMKPEIFFDWIEDNKGNISFYILAIATRLIFGFLLLIAAKDSKYPNAIKIFGYIVLIAAIVFIFIGHTGFQDFLSSTIPFAKSAGSVLGLFGTALGGFLIYAFPKGDTPSL